MIGKGILKSIFDAIRNLGSPLAENLVTFASGNLSKSIDKSLNIQQIFTDTGNFFIKNENDKSSFFDDLSRVLSEENMKAIARNLKDVDGYRLEDKLEQSFMELMRQYEIPSEYADAYCTRIMYAIIEQISVTEPEIYNQFYLQEWREEQNEILSAQQQKIDLILREQSLYRKEKLQIYTYGQMDVILRKRTANPSIGVDFFTVDDKEFQNQFEQRSHSEIVYIKGVCREEVIYSVLNELNRLGDRRPIFVVKNLESWQQLPDLTGENNIYIPWFYADEIEAISGNTNIFVLDEDMPVYGHDFLKLRPRTRDTITRCLREAGAEPEQAYALVSDTHGLYIPLKKHLFRGEYLKKPEWMDGISVKVQKICLLLGKWEDIDGDRLGIETLYGGKYEDFLSEILPYTKGEDPFIYVIKRGNVSVYFLASVENTWACIQVMTDEPMWKKFTTLFHDIMGEKENLLTYSGQENIVAQINGESLFWSATIRNGMLKTLIIKASYLQHEECQHILDDLVLDILNCIQTTKDWSYIAEFWTDLCEISPKAVLTRLDQEWDCSTGLLVLFQNQSSDFLFGRNDYIKILRGVGQLLTQKLFFWDAFRWLLKIDSLHFNYKSNAPKDCIEKVLCSWYNFCALENYSEKITAAELALKMSNNTWNYLFDAMPRQSGCVIIDLYTPQYREHAEPGTVRVYDMQETVQGYMKLLLSNMEFSSERWKKLLEASDDLLSDYRFQIVDGLLDEAMQMTDEEITGIKNCIRNIIYKHRYFHKTASWALPEEQVHEYEVLLNELHTKQPEYEFAYLFHSKRSFLLLHPAPHQQEDEIAVNQKLTEQLICEGLQDFQHQQLNLEILVRAVSNDQGNTLGASLAQYWDGGEWNPDVFNILLNVQPYGFVAVDYLSHAARGHQEIYEEVLMRVQAEDGSEDLLVRIYRAEASGAKKTPLITDADEGLKRRFWKSSIFLRNDNSRWAVEESKKYGDLSVYLEQLWYLHFNASLSPAELLVYLDDIEKMTQQSENGMSEYYIQEFLKILQNEYMHEELKCMRIANIEVYFVHFLESKDMKCYLHMNRKSPYCFVHLLNELYPPEHKRKGSDALDVRSYQNLYTLFDKTKFCPAEERGVVNEEKLMDWIETFRELMTKQDQASLIDRMLVRLFTFSPVGQDGHKPCEAVRMAIERYFDYQMVSEYARSIFFSRGLYTPTAGISEKKIAKSYKENAEYLRPHAPKTARIYDQLYEMYQGEAVKERIDAEAVWN